MDPAEFRRHGPRAGGLDRRRTSSRLGALPRAAARGAGRRDAARCRRTRPSSAEPFDAVFADFERVLVPALTHWNHPGFLAYFASSASPPGVLGELLSAALNQQAMLWKTSPAATELEEVTLGWLRELIGLPPAFDGVIYDTASISTLHALAAARERAVPGVRAHGLAGGRTRPLRVYCSEHAHSSVDKAVMLLGLGHDALRRIPADADFRMRPEALARRHRTTTVARGVHAGGGGRHDRHDVHDQRRSRGGDRRRLRARAACGCTSTRPTPASRRWCPSCAPHFDGLGARRLDRRQPAQVAVHADGPQRALLPAHGRAARGVLAGARLPARRPRATAGVRNLMDTGIQLGRRFRVAEAVDGAARLRRRGHARAVCASTCGWRACSPSWVDADPRFERVAPVPFSVVCFRARGRRAVARRTLDALQRAADATRVNATGEVFLSHTRLNGALTLRLAMGHMRTTEAHVPPRVGTAAAAMPAAGRDDNGVGAADRARQAGGAGGAAGAGIRAAALDEAAQLSGPGAECRSGRPRSCTASACPPSSPRSGAPGTARPAARACASPATSARCPSRSRDTSRAAPAPPAGCERSGLVASFSPTSGSSDVAAAAEAEAPSSISASLMSWGMTWNLPAGSW